ncbi:MAG: shikimate dehydrogenase [Clostridia bacterium]|nr:MAG: shikimate dehydrogenase [Clostridia bacterium]
MSPAVTGKTKLLGVLGYPVEHSLSPAMHNAALAGLGLDVVYLPLPVRPADLGRAVRGMQALGFIGANVTIPHKEAALTLADELGAEARLIGAVNTLVFRGGKILGHNTDAAGFLLSLREEADFDPAGKTCLILGAGGAARAVAVALVQAGSRAVYIANRTRERAAELASGLQRDLGVPARALSIEEGELAPVLEQADLVVQASPVGMHPHRGAPPIIDPALLSPAALVYDLIYNPPETTFLRLAREKGCRTLNGLGMLVYQGAMAFKLWTGVSAPVAVMRAAITDLVRS